MTEIMPTCFKYDGPILLIHEDISSGYPSARLKVHAGSSENITAKEFNSLSNDSNPSNRSFSWYNDAEDLSASYDNVYCYLAKKMGLTREQASVSYLCIDTTQNKIGALNAKYFNLEIDNFYPEEDTKAIEEQPAWLAWLDAQGEAFLPADLVNKYLHTPMAQRHIDEFGGLSDKLGWGNACLFSCAKEYYENKKMTATERVPFINFVAPPYDESSVLPKLTDVSAVTWKSAPAPTEEERLWEITRSFCK